MSSMRKEVIGRCTLYNGDCADILPLIGKVKSVLTDPPYGIGIAANPVRQKHSKKQWDSAPPPKPLIESLLNCSEDQIIWGGNYFHLPPSRGYFIWDKIQPEDFSLAMCEYAWFSKDHNAKIFRKSPIGYDKFHPTQKPVELMQFCLKYLSLDGIVLDPFMGSGSTGVACQKSGYNFVGIEIDPEYFDIACKRIEEASKQIDLFF